MVAELSDLMEMIAMPSVLLLRNGNDRWPLSDLMEMIAMPSVLLLRRPLGSERRE